MSIGNVHNLPGGGGGGGGVGGFLVFQESYKSPYA